MDNKKTERKTLIDLGYSKYWSIIYTDGSYEHIPVIETKPKRSNSVRNRNRKDLTDPSKRITLLISLKQTRSL